MDLALFTFFYQFSGVAYWLDWIIIFFAEYVSYIIIAAVVISAIRLWRCNKTPEAFKYLLALFSAGVAKGIVTIIRFFYHHPRPSEALHLTSLFPELSYSFPSGHAMFFFALATGVYLTNKTFGRVLFALAILMGMARIAAGVHWPSDIVGGAVLGIILTLFLFKLHEIFIHRQIK